MYKTEIWMGSKVGIGPLPVSSTVLSTPSAKPSAGNCAVGAGHCAAGIGISPQAGSAACVPVGGSNQNVNDLD